MDEIRIDIIEKQMDVLAGRTAELERKVAALLGLLGRDAVASRLGLEKAAIRDAGREGMTSISAELRHSNERARMIGEAERDQLTSRLDFIRRELGRVTSPAVRSRRARGRSRRKSPAA